MTTASGPHGGPRWPDSEEADPGDDDVAVGEIVEDDGDRTAPAVPSDPTGSEDLPGFGDEELTFPDTGLDDWGTDPRDLKSELERVTAERDEYLDALRRLQADFDNFRKRSVRQQTDLLEHATEGLCLRLLPLLDALDLATKHVAEQGDETDAAKALGQIDALFTDVLGREGIERIDAVGVPFDPTIHDAVGHVPAGDPATGDGDDAGLDASAAADANETGAVVADVMRAGYRFKSKVLRPAMVTVRG
jgi:molecular chaperone GrpE